MFDKVIWDFKSVRRNLSKSLLEVKMKNKKLIALIIFITSSNVLANELKGINNKEAAYLLTNFTVLAETKYPASEAMHARILEVVDFGECDGTPSSCPKSTLFISVSEYGEYPEQELYKLPKMHYWKFTSWEHLPKTDTSRDFIVIKLSAEIPSQTPKKGWWKSKEFLVHANYRSAKINEVKTSNK